MSNPALNQQSLPSRLTQRQAALVEMDITNCLGIAETINSETSFVLFLDAFYQLATQQVTAHGGEVVKYLGDSCLAIFDESACTDAINSIVATREQFPELCERFGVKPTGIRATVHTGSVIVGEFGPNAQRDVLGKRANELFQTRSRGITITEAVYRKLPSDQRGPWKKRGGQVVYIRP